MSNDFLALAAVLAFARVFSVLELSSLFGPLIQVAAGFTYSRLQQAAPHSVTGPPS